MRCAPLIPMIPDTAEPCCGENGIRVMSWEVQQWSRQEMVMGQGRVGAVEKKWSLRLAALAAAVGSLARVHAQVTSGEATSIRLIWFELDQCQ